MQNAAQRIVFVNGVYTPLADAKISIMDRGFLFADGVYEVSAVLGGQLVDNDAHLARLRRSLSALQIPNPHYLKFGCDFDLTSIVPIVKTS